MSMSSDQNRVAVERLLDQSAPGWRKDFDQEDISSGSHDDDDDDDNDSHHQEFSSVVCSF